jgi:hypothetical protein
MATNIEIKKIAKNSKMNRFQWKWISLKSDDFCILAAIFGSKWPP